MGAGFHQIGQCQIRLDPLMADGNHFPRQNVADKLSTNGSQGTAFRCQDISIISFSKAKRFQAIGVTDADQLAGTHDHQTVCTLKLFGCI